MVVQPPDRVLVPTQRNKHNNVFEFFYRTRAPNQVEDDNFRLNTRFLGHSSFASPAINQKKKKGHKSCSPHPKCCLLFLGTSDYHPVRSPISSLRGANSFKLNCCYYKGECWFQAKNTLAQIRQRETSPLLGRPTPMRSRKKLQKKEASAPIPTKYLEYDASQWGAVRVSTLIETAHPSQAPQ